MHIENPINLTRDTIAELINVKPTTPAVTIYIPTHRTAAPAHMSEDQIRCKNLIHKAIEILKTRDDGNELVVQLNEELDRLLDNRVFWEDQTEGLLLCIRPGVSASYHLPIDVEEYVAVDKQFHLAPVFGLLQELQDYCLLTVRQRNPMLYKGDMYGLYPTESSLPSSPEDSLNLDEVNQKAQQQRSAGATSGYNGRGGERDPEGTDRLHFWRLLDERVCAAIPAKCPLLLAGTESELSEYRSVSHYPHLMKGTLGGFTGTNLHDIIPTITTLVRRELTQPTKTAVLQRYMRQKGEAPERVADTMAAILDVAKKGRIETLLLASMRITTDNVRDTTQQLPVLIFPPEASAATVQDIAHLAWTSGADIVAIDADAMPEPGALLLALLRY